MGHELAHYEGHLMFVLLLQWLLFDQNKSSYSVNGKSKRRDNFLQSINQTLDLGLGLGVHDYDLSDLKHVI